MWRVNHAFMQHALGVGQSTGTERSVWTKVAMNGGYSDEARTGAVPVLNPLAQGARRFARSRARLPCAADDLKQLLRSDPGKDFSVENRTQLG